MEPELLRDHARFVEARCPDGETVAADMREAADEIERLRSDRKTALDAASHGIGFWAWQGDGEDHLESLTCPILISAEQMREIQAELKRLMREVGELRGFLERSRVFWGSAAVKEMLEKP